MPTIRIAKPTDAKGKLEIYVHERLAFHHFATYEKAGYKLGKWKNVGWWQLSINDYGNAPAAPIKFSELNTDFLLTLFSEKIKGIKG